jgi:hypothetical protein
MTLKKQRQVKSKQNEYEKKWEGEEMTEEDDD